MLITTFYILNKHMISMLFSVGLKNDKNQIWTIQLIIKLIHYFVVVNNV